MYGVLGQVTVAGASVTPRRERELLGLLVAAHGRPVAVDRIVEELWADGAPRSSVQVAVSRLRATLDPARSGPSRVERTPAGYRFLAAADEVDAWVLEDLCEKALAAPAAADRVILASQADELWAGEPYPDCQAPTLRAEAVRLIELHVTVLEARAEGLLVLGQPAAAVRLLTPVAPVHAYREQLWALLARAQFACARQADALATLATLRTRLAEDLGVDPSSVVRAMEQAILTQDPGLTPVPTTNPGAITHRRRSRVRRRCRAASVTAGLHLSS